MRRLQNVKILTASLAVAAIFGAGCSSGHSASSPTTAAPATSTTAPGSASSPPAATGSTWVAGAVPAVSGATNLKAEPKIAAGGSNPPAQLTGKDLVVGTGAEASATDTVEVQYVGALYTTGHVFDASWTDNGPATFPLSQVVPGFRDAIAGMRVGGRREIVIPPALGYGATGSPPVIPANATLVFVIDLLAVQAG